jgi:uncharacterized protein YjbI with pentapeptide repeats
MSSARALLSAPLLLGAVMVCAQPPVPAETEVIITDDSGDQVLRLSAAELTSEPQSLEAGRYLLKVTGPGEFELVLGSYTELELRKPSEQMPADTRPHTRHQAQNAVIDFDEAPGDQRLREVHAAGPGERYQAQLTAVGLPHFYGWSAVIEFDPQQLGLVPDSFRPSNFLPGLMPLVDLQNGRVEFGGADFTRATAAGDGDLGVLAFETLSGYAGRAEIRLLALNLRSASGTHPIPGTAQACISNQQMGTNSGPQRSRDRSPQPPPALAGQAALDALLNDKACPGCDLSDANLMQQDLTEADLSGADLSRANLFRAKLERADLHGARLVGANAMQANLRETDLTDADLTGARLTGARLDRADLSRAVIGDAKLNGANLTDTVWIDGSQCGRGSVGRCRN